DMHTVTAAPTTTTLTVTPSSQQYSDTTVLNATVTPFKILTQNLTGSVSFYVGAAAVSCGMSAPAGAVGTVAIAAADQGVAELRYKIDKAPGSYTVTACFYSSNASFANSHDSQD